MKKKSESLSISQMIELDIWALPAGSFAIAGLVAIAMGIYFLINCSAMALACIPLGCAFVFFGLQILLSYMQRVQITAEKVYLMLGPIVVRQIPVSEIRTIAFSVVQPNPRWDWKVAIIVLSPQTSTHMQLSGKASIKNAVKNQIPSILGTDANDPRVQIDAFINAHMASLRFEKEEGIWIEFSEERLAAIKEWIPDAEDWTFQTISK